MLCVYRAENFGFGLRSSVRFGYESSTFSGIEHNRRVELNIFIGIEHNRREYNICYFLSPFNWFLF